MIIVEENPPQIVLQTNVGLVGGGQNLQIASVSARVYHLVSGSESDVLTSTPLVQVGSSQKWRYVWTPASLLEDQYFVEYTLTDNGGNVDIVEDDLCVWYDGWVTPMTISAIGNTQTDYHADGTTVKRTFNLFDQFGVPTSTNIYKRT